APLEPDAPPGYTAGFITSVDGSAINLAGTRLEAWDIQADYAWKNGRVGDVRLYAVATYQPNFERRTMPITPFVESTGFSDGVLNWRGNGGLTWSKGPSSVGWNAQFYDAYRVCRATSSAATCATAELNQGARSIPSQMYHDMFFAYRLDAHAGRAIAGSEI